MFDVWVGGEPPPSIEWFRDEVKVTTDDAISLSLYTKNSSAYTMKNAVLSIPKAIEDLHAGVYKLRLKNESGVFESISTVDIDGPFEKKQKKLEEQKLKEEQAKQEMEEKERREKEELMNLRNKNDLKPETEKEEDRDSGLKIGEESLNGSETDYSYEYTDASEEDYEDYFEEDQPVTDVEEVKKREFNTETPNTVDVVLDEIVNESEETESNVNSKEDIRASVPISNCDINTGDSLLLANSENDNIEIACRGNTSDEDHPIEDCENKGVTEVEDDPNEGWTYDPATGYWNHDIIKSREDQLQSDDCSSDSDVCSDQLVPDKKESVVEGEQENNCSENSDDLVNSSETPEQIELDKIRGDRAEQSNAVIEKSSSVTARNADEDTCDEINCENYEKYDPITTDPTIADITDVTQVITTDPPPTVFNKEEYMWLLQSRLDEKLKETGFVRSSSASKEKFAEGDGCIIELLDQMNREDQDFKVWERNDFSFLRWYVTRQMETLKGKVDNLRFVELIGDDFDNYLEKISEDGIAIDRAFIQAAATIFNKDIILIPIDGDTDFDVIVGGLKGASGKGNPLYLGHIGKSENNSDMFVSVLPERVEQPQISNILTGQVISADTVIAVTDEDGDTKDKTVTGSENEGENIEQVNTSCRPQWKRMDSYNGAASKDLDSIIQNIINEDNMNDVFKKLDQCDSETDEDEEMLAEQPCNGDIQESVEEENDPNEGWKYDPDTGYWNLDSVESNQENISITTDEAIEEKSPLNFELHNVSNDNIVSSDNSDQSLELENEKSNLLDDEIHNKYVEETNKQNIVGIQENISQIENKESEESCDGWIYDPVTGYWIEDTSNNDNNLENENVKCQISTCAQFLPDSADSLIANDSDENGSFKAKEDKLPENETDKEIFTEENCNNSAVETIEEDLDKNNILPPPAACPDKKLLRKIKISVAVDEGDKVKEFDTHPDCLPVDLLSECPESVAVLSANQDTLAGEDSKEVPAFAENAANNREVLEPNSDLNKSDNWVTADKTTVTQPGADKDKSTPISKNLNNDITASCEICVKAEEKPEEKPRESAVEEEGGTTEVKMRGREPLRKYSQKKTASYRWSGTEMLQIEGVENSPNLDIPDDAQVQSRVEMLQATKSNIGYKKVNARMERELVRLGLERSATAADPVKDEHNCLKALIDQLSQPGQDDNTVWENDDHPFLRWYIAKQLEIQVRRGNGELYLRPGLPSVEDFLAVIQREDHYMDNDFVFSASKILHKDILVISCSSSCGQEEDEGAVVTRYSGGPGGEVGKGEPLYLAHLAREEAGQDYYQSVLPSQHCNIDYLLTAISQ